MVSLVATTGVTQEFSTLAIEMQSELKPAIVIAFCSFNLHQAAHKIVSGVEDKQGITIKMGSRSSMPDCQIAENWELSKTLETHKKQSLKAKLFFEFCSKGPVFLDATLREFFGRQRGCPRTSDTGQSAHFPLEYIYICMCICINNMYVHISCVYIYTHVYITDYYST